MAEDGESKKSSQPLRGVVLCCTSIPPEDRADLAACAEQMGALHKLDLTSDVTHLIVGDSNTPKYKYVARERPDVKVLSPKWVDAIRQLWIHDEEIDLDQLERSHRLPVLAGLKISLTGFDDVSDRQRLQKLIVENGADYHGDLIRSVTHLLANKAEGEKYKHATLWGLKIVSLEWLMDSLERGMILEEGLYNPLTPPGERGRDAWVRTVAVATSLGKRARQDGQSVDDGGDDPVGRRKLRRTASSKLESQNSSIWGDIVGAGFEQGPSKKRTGDEGRKSHQFSKDIHQFTLDAGREPEQLQAVDEYRRPTNGHLQVEQGNGQSRDSEGKKNGLFDRMCFYLHGFDRKQTRVLQDHILSQDGDVAPSLSDFTASSSTMESQAQRAYVVMPHTFLREAQQLELPQSGHQPILVSEWWIEKCLYQKNVTDPAHYTPGRPFSQFPLEGFEQLTICSTGFTGVELLHVSKAVKLMGAKYDEFLTPSASVLVCNAPLSNKDKLRHALNWNVPGVSSQWLWESIERGEKLGFNDYLVRGSEVVGRASPVPSSRDTFSSTDNARRFRSDTREVGNPVGAKDSAPPHSHQAIPTEQGAAPLQNLPREINAPKQPSDSAKDNNSNHLSIRPRRSAPPPASEDLNTAIAAVLARKQATSLAQQAGSSTTLNSSNNPSHPPPPPLQGRKKPAPPRLQGRDSSNLSTTTTSTTMTTDFSLTTSFEDHHHHSTTTTLPAFDPAPSQKVLYEDPDVREHRERLVRKLGGTIDAAAAPPKPRSIGVVRDMGGVGSRTRLKTGTTTATTTKTI